MRKKEFKMVLVFPGPDSIGEKVQDAVSNPPQGLSDQESCDYYVTLASAAIVALREGTDDKFVRDFLSDTLNGKNAIATVITREH